MTTSESHAWIKSAGWVLLTALASAHDSSGVTFGSRQYDMTVTWRSAPIEHRYRAYARTRNNFV